MVIKHFKDCTIVEVGNKAVIAVNIGIDHDVPTIGEVVEAEGRFWTVNGIEFYPSSDKNIGLIVEEFGVDLVD